jgi:uncharacterized protein
MSDTDPIELVRRLYDAFEDGDHDGIRHCLSADLRWRQAGTAVPAAGQDLVGREALLASVIEPLEQDWEGFTEEIEQLIAGDDGHVVATGTYRGTNRRSGRQLQAEFCHVWLVRDGRVVTFRQYTDTAVFQEASRSPADAGEP